MLSIVALFLVLYGGSAVFWDLAFHPDVSLYSGLLFDLFVVLFSAVVLTVTVAEQAWFR